MNNTITEEQKNYFRSIAKLDSTEKYIFVGKEPVKHGLTNFDGYYGTPSSSMIPHPNLGGYSDCVAYYMLRSQWEEGFGPFLLTTEGKTIEEQYKLAQTFVGQKSKHAGTIYQISIITKYSPSINKTCDDALKHNDIVVVVRTTGNYAFPLEEHLKYINGLKTRALCIDNDVYTFDSSTQVIFKNGAAWMSVYLLEQEIPKTENLLGLYHKVLSFVKGKN